MPINMGSPQLKEFTSVEQIYDLIDFKEMNDPSESALDELGFSEEDEKKFLNDMENLDYKFQDGSNMHLEFEKNLGLSEKKLVLRIISNLISQLENKQSFSDYTSTVLNNLENSKKGSLVDYLQTDPNANSLLSLIGIKKYISSFRIENGEVKKNYSPDFEDYEFDSNLKENLDNLGISNEVVEYQGENFVETTTLYKLLTEKVSKTNRVASVDKILKTLYPKNNKNLKVESFFKSVNGVKKEYKGLFYEKDGKKILLLSNEPVNASGESYRFTYNVIEGVKKVEKTLQSLGILGYEQGISKLKDGSLDVNLPSNDLIDKVKNNSNAKIVVVGHYSPAGNKGEENFLKSGIKNHITGELSEKANNVFGEDWKNKYNKARAVLAADKLIKQGVPIDKIELKVNPNADYAGVEYYIYEYKKKENNRNNSSFDKKNIDNGINANSNNSSNSNRKVIVNEKIVK